MKIFILILALILTLNSQNLAGNSSLGTPFALGGNFGEQQTQKSSFIPKISSKYKTSTANTRIYNLRIAESSTQNAESTLDSANLLAMTENKDFAESPQNAQISKSPQDEFANPACKKDDIIGFWLSPRDRVSARSSIIEIFKKDGKYFAYNVAFLDELPPKKDVLNQNFALREREILGSVYAYNLERSGEESYINGRYYDFNKGKIFHLKAKLDCNKLILLISADNVGFLGKKKIYSALEKDEAELYIKTRPTIDFSGVK